MPPKRNVPDPASLPELQQRETRNAVTRCVYFPDGDLVARLTKVLNNHPRSSLSNVVLQVLQQVVPKMEELSGDSHVVEMPIKIWL